MMSAGVNKPWESMTHEEKQAWLFRQRKETLSRFLEHGSISKAQFDKSLHALIEKAGVADRQNGSF